MAVHAAIHAKQMQRPRESGLDFLERLALAEQRDAQSNMRPQMLRLHSPTSSVYSSASSTESLSSVASDASSSKAETATGETKKRKKETRMERRAQKKREKSGKAMLLPIKSLDGKSTHYVARRTSNDGLAPSEYVRALQIMIAENQ